MRSPGCDRIRSPTRLAGLTLAASLALALASGACSGGGHRHATPSPTPAAPANVVATGDFHSLHVHWDPVSGIDNYLVYVSTSAILSTGGLTPIGLTVTNVDIPGLPDWVTFHVRVAGEKAGVVGALSTEATAMP